ncbi:MAG: Inner membrane protein YbaL [bacterium ADurb.Bin400]|nr:MAG: Inner membrane protein YbaL [bacterium ADurb.Bin400]
MYKLKQPLIIGHIATGLIVGPYLFNLVKANETIEIFSQIGIALLLFIIGLNLNPRVIKEVGKVSLITGVGQVLFTSAIGYMIGITLGFGPTASFYIAIALTFSSTIIILKLLSDKKDLGRLYGKIAVGFLLVQNIIATLILIALSTLSQGGDLTQIMLATLLKGIVLVVLLTAFSIRILPKMGMIFAKSQEFLSLFSVGWGLGLAALFSLAGFSIEIGALVAGVTLATSTYTYEISSRMKPLRDFFIILFFIMIGSKMSPDNLQQLIVPAATFSAFILIGNPLIVMILMALLGYDKKTNFKAGLTVAQISEFSLILIVMGHRLGHLSDEIVSLVTIVGLLTIAVSTYLIIYSDKIYAALEPYLVVFERKNHKRERRSREEHDIILFGFDNIG